MVNIIKGDLIKLAKDGQFDVIGHGCNCFCRMKRGVAPLMNAAFGCNNPDLFSMENKFYEGDIRKLGQIQAAEISSVSWRDDKEFKLTVVNMYTQYHWNDPSTAYEHPLDYDAMAMCLRKMNHIYQDKHIALPGMIGCGLAGGNTLRVYNMIAKELKDCDVSIVFIDENKIPNFLRNGS